MYRIEQMTIENARVISTWKYPGEYAMYSFENDAETIRELMSGEYFSCINDADELVGYFCFGCAAQIPTAENDTADSGKIDIGLGLAPALCGHGYGKDFMQSGIDYAKMSRNAVALRLVVAKCNKRAIALYKSCGFVQTGEVRHRNSGAAFLVMQRTL